MRWPARNEELCFSIQALTEVEDHVENCHEKSLV
jgi:hypothetical protein